MNRDELTVLLGRKMKPGRSNDPRILVDPENEWLLHWKWTTGGSHGHYVYRDVGPARNQARIYLAHVILGVDMRGKSFTLRNDNHLDLRRCNLMVATKSEKLGHANLHRNNTSGYKGVRWHTSANRWVAEIAYNKQRLFLGCFVTPEEAAEVYDEKARELFGEHARTNAMLGLYPWQQEKAAD